MDSVQQKVVLLEKDQQFIPFRELSRNGPCGITSYLTILFKFLNWSYMIPYKIVVSKDGTSYRISTNNWKMVLIVILQVYFTWYHMVHLATSSRRDASIRGILSLAVTFSLTCWTNVVLFVLWRRRKTFIQLLSRIDAIWLRLEAKSAKLTTPKKAIILATTLCTCCLLMTVYEVTLFYLKLHKDNRHLKICEILFEQTAQLQESYPELGSSFCGKLMIWTLGVIYILVIKIYYFSIGHMGYAVLFITCMVMKELFQGLNSFLPEKFSSRSEIDEAVTIYTEIRNLTTMVNRTIGSMMAWGILGHLPYNAYKVNDLIGGSPLTKISYVLHIMMYLGILLAGAKVYSEINKFADKLACDELTLKDPELQTKVGLLLQQSRVAGLRGGNLFRMTYGFLGNITGVILTYAIVIVQFQDKSETSSTQSPW